MWTKNFWKLRPLLWKLSDLCQIKKENIHAKIIFRYNDTIYSFSSFLLKEDLFLNLYCKGIYLQIFLIRWYNFGKQNSSFFFFIKKNTIFSIIPKIKTQGFVIFQTTAYYSFLCFVPDSSELSFLRVVIPLAISSCVPWSSLMAVTVQRRIP